MIRADELIAEPENTEVIYTWDDGTSNPHKTLSKEGLHEVYIQNGCVTDTIKINIIYTTDCPEIFYIPNAFSPNNDGLNDRFRIIEENITVSRFDIYSRWGTKIFSSVNATLGWDGTVNGLPGEVGVYLYILEYSTNISEQSICKKGYVTLVK